MCAGGEVRDGQQPAERDASCDGQARDEGVAHASGTAPQTSRAALALRQEPRSLPARPRVRRHAESVHRGPQR